MKSKTSFFNPTAFFKDVRRFAPAWVLYFICLLLGVTVIVTGTSSSYYCADSVAEIVPYMALVNIVYGFLNAQLLFGDLYNTRLCYALHAMPLRRECWYCTHLAAGLAFAAVPNLVAALIGLLVGNVGAAWSVAFWWFAGSMLQYLCFFGIAVFCMMLCGNRFAAAVVYGLINFFSLLVYWLVDSLYEPLLHGILISEDPFLYTCPVAGIVNNNDLVQVQAERIVDEFGEFLRHEITGVVLGNWLPMLAYALIGVVLMVLGLVMYRKRDLESAGDFSAFRAAEPILLVIYTITAGGMLHLFGDLFSMQLRYVFLGVGLAVGFFTGLMLLRRTTRVFSLKAFARFAAFALVVALSLVLTRVDPLGLTRWVPDADEVVSVRLDNRYAINGYTQYELTLTETQDIEAILAAHRDSLTELDTQEELELYGPRLYTLNYSIEYTLKNGSVRTRFYNVNVKSEAGQLLKPYFSSFEYVLGFTEAEIPAVAKNIRYIYSNGVVGDELGAEEFAASVDREAMLRAIAADCAAGNMSPHHEYIDYDADGKTWRSIYLEFEISTTIEKEGGIGDIYRSDWKNLYVSPKCTNTLKWMEENGLYDPTLNAVG